MYGYGFANTFNRIGGGVQVSYLVDDYSPLAAYSLRKISSTATNAVRVRRSSDNAEQDIGFVGVDLDTASLASFVGANNGFVVKWYDQSGNGWNISTSNAVRQPRIVNSGNIETLGGENALYFDGSLHFLINTSFSASLKPMTAWQVGSVASTTYGSIIGGGATNTFAWQHTNGYKHRLLKINAAELAVSTNTVTQNAQTLNGMLYDNSGNWAFYKNGATNGSGTNNTTINGLDLVIGASLEGADHYNGKMQEVIIFNVDKSADRAAIETEINSYYGIY